MKIIVKPLKKSGLSFGLETSPAPTMRDIGNWESIVREMLTFAYLNRPAYLITVQPQRWSLVNFSPDAHETIRENVNGKPYFFIIKMRVLRNCSKIFPPEMKISNALCCG